MPRSSDRQDTVPVGPWPHGLNNWADPSFIDPGELSVAVNVDTSAEGHIKPRPSVNAIAAYPDGRHAVAGYRYLLPAYVGDPGPRPEFVSASYLVEGDAGPGVGPPYELRGILHIQSLPVIDDRSGNVDSSIATVQAQGKVVVYRGAALPTVEPPSPVSAGRHNALYLCWGGTALCGLVGSDGLLTGNWKQYTSTPVWSNPTFEDGTETLPSGVQAHKLGTGAGWVPPSRVLMVYNFGAGEWLVSAKGDTIRWSYPISPKGDTGFENWREFDVIRLALDGTDEITSMRQIGQDLLVFTERSTWLFSGGSPYNWVPRLLSRNHGVTDHSSTVHAGQYGVAFFETDTQSLWVYRDGQFVDLWQNRIRVSPALGNNIGTENQPVYPRRHEQVAYRDGKLYVSTSEVEYSAYQEGGGPLDVTYVYDFRRNATVGWPVHVAWWVVVPQQNGSVMLGLARYWDSWVGLFGSASAGAYLEGSLVPQILWLNEFRSSDHIVRRGSVADYARPVVRAATKRVSGEFPDARDRWRRAIVQARGVANPDTDPRVTPRPFQAMWEIEGQMVGSQLQSAHDPPVDKFTNATRFPVTVGSSEQAVVPSPRRLGREARLFFEMDTPNSVEITRVMLRYLPGPRRF